MENTMSRILVTSVVRKALNDMKESPERATRNLVDMALHFSEGRFQQRFFTSAQTMLKNENSGYYGLIRDTMAYVDTERLFTFGMNLGYNGCTEGAQKIRASETKLGFNIPWTITLKLDARIVEERMSRYHDLIRQGEGLGIYAWMLFASDTAQAALSFPQEHPDSAFCLFCEADDLTPGVLEQAAELHNLMLVVRYEESAADICAQMRELGLLYSVWYEYGIQDVETILNGDLFYSAQQLFPIFTVLVPERSCPASVQRLVHQTAVRTRNDQIYRTVPWEIQEDNRLIDSIISDDTCAVTFERSGSLAENGTLSLFTHSLTDILSQVYPKAKEHTP